MSKLAAITAVLLVAGTVAAGELKNLPANKRPGFDLPFKNGK